MATSATERKNQVLVGELPQDFLRIENSLEQQQVLADQQTAAMLQAQQGGFSFLQGARMPRLSITLVQAKLTKNYGLTKMDPYCRIRVGHSVFETQTAVNGSKNPRWNKTVYCCLPPGVDNVYIEIFDERAFTMDDRVAWAHISISPTVLKGETVDDWYPLSGKQGEEREGSINLVLSYTEAAAAQPAPAMYPNQAPYAPGAAYGQPMVVVPGGAPVFYQPMQVGGVPVHMQQQPPMQPGMQPMPPGMQPMPQPMPQQQMPPPQPPGPPFTDDDVNLVKEMFPNIDEDVIRSLFEANNGDKDITINNLLSMSS